MFAVLDSELFLCTGYVLTGVSYNYICGYFFLIPAALFTGIAYTYIHIYMHTYIFSFVYKHTRFQCDIGFNQPTRKMHLEMHLVSV